MLHRWVELKLHFMHYSVFDTIVLCNKVSLQSLEGAGKVLNKTCLNLSQICCVVVDAGITTSKCFFWGFAIHKYHIDTYYHERLML